MAGDLTIDANSNLYLDYSTYDMAVPLKVAGNLVNNGQLSASDVSGGDIEVSGNWSNANIFNPRGRKVTFNGNTSTLVSVTGTNYFDYLVINKAGCGPM